jgi:hypothetical protein
VYVRNYLLLERAIHGMLDYVLGMDEKLVWLCRAEE